jgi:hypothetical protein
LHDKDLLDDGEQRSNETDEACSSEDDGQHSDRKKRTYETFDANADWAKYFEPVPGSDPAMVTCSLCKAPQIRDLTNAKRRHVFGRNTTSEARSAHQKKLEAYERNLIRQETGELSLCAAMCCVLVSFMR